ncbi:MAG: NAD-dependent epimerase/dehydratase family protein [Bacteroidales bacterium]
MVIVTGATGLVGSHVLLELCSKGKRVKAIVRNKANIRQVETIFRYYAADPERLLCFIEWVEADVSDYARIFEIIDKDDEVFHCAAKVAFSRREKQKVVEINIGGTANIVNACLEKGARKLCHVSSVAAIGRAEHGFPADESCIWDSMQRHTVYALSKFHSEMEVWRGIEEGLQAVIVNPSIIIGPTLNITGTGALLNAVKQGLKFYPPGSMGFVDVRDVARVMVSLMDSNIAGERFILNSENLSYQRFLTMVANEFQKPAPSIPLKRWMAHVAVVASAALSILQRKPSSLTREIIQSAFAHDSFSAAKVMEKLQYRFIPISDALSNVKRFYDFVEQNNVC